MGRQTYDQYKEKNMNEPTCGPIAEGKQSEVAKELDTLKNIVSRLEALSGEVLNRLEPVCREEPSGPNSGCAPEQERGTEMGRVLRQLSNNIECSTDRLQKILTTLEL